MLDAEECFRKALELRPKYPHAHHELAELLKKQKKYDEAKKEYELAIATDSNYVTAIVNLGALLMQVVGREDDGIGWLQHAIKIDPTDDFRLRCWLQSTLIANSLNAHSNMPNRQWQ